MVVKGLPATAANEVYEVWVIVGTNAPTPVGALSQSGALAFMTGTPGPVPAGATVALTREPGPNPTAPTSPILVEGRRRPLGVAAWPGVSPCQLAVLVRE